MKLLFFLRLQIITKGMFISSLQLLVDAQTDDDSQFIKRTVTSTSSRLLFARCTQKKQ